MYRLKNADYDAYLVGGCVRDLLLGIKPKDFDVVTNAQPEEIRQLFGNCRLIGRRFRLAHVHFGNDVIEVATYRAEHDQEEINIHQNEDGMILRDNKFGTIEQDAWRRDFRVNALYYNIHDFTVTDFTGGLDDIEARKLGLIGDPEKRFREDPVRMLRAVRIAVKLGFSIADETDKGIRLLASSLSAVSSARLYEEVQKLFLAGHAQNTFLSMRDYGLFEQLFPGSEKSFKESENSIALEMLVNGFNNTDKRVAEGKPVIPAFLFSFILWHKMQGIYRKLKEKNRSSYEAFATATRDTLFGQVKEVTIPRRVTTQIREIWSMQMRLNNRVGKRPFRLVDNPRFRAAYDFLLLRNQSGEALDELSDWWTRFQDESEEQKIRMIRSLRKDKSKPGKSAKKSRRKRASSKQSQISKPGSG